uniref:Uncharacterized protein n=1 Tax=Clostridium carboxidivorans P7 TaxID=536227 RepID=E2IQD6_9CLOT|nr:hypothetical protein Ccar_3260 [Clostridium carboxidivorans P7]
MPIIFFAYLENCKECLPTPQPTSNIEESLLRICFEVRNFTNSIFSSLSLLFIILLNSSALRSQNFFDIDRFFRSHSFHIFSNTKLSMLNQLHTFFYDNLKYLLLLLNDSIFVINFPLYKTYLICFI